MTDDHFPAAGRAAKRTSRDPDRVPWDRSALRSHARMRAYGICEWPDCGEPGDHMAHVYGRGSGGRSSADVPENVAWLCRRHHDSLDGRRRFRFDEDALPLLRSIRKAASSLRCSWYCDDAPATLVAGRPVCDLHERVLHGRTVPNRRQEVALALAKFVERLEEHHLEGMDPYEHPTPDPTR